MRLTSIPTTPGTEKRNPSPQFLVANSNCPVFQFPVNQDTTKLRTDLPGEWVNALSTLVDAPKPEEVLFPAIPDWGYGGNEIPCMLRFPCWNAKPVYDFGHFNDASSFDGKTQYYTYHLTFWNIMLDDVFYHQGVAFLAFLAKYSAGNRFAGTMYEACASFPQMIYFIDDNLRIVNVGSGGKDMDKVAGISF